MKNLTYRQRAQRIIDYKGGPSESGSFGALLDIAAALWTIAAELAELRELKDRRAI